MPITNQNNYLLQLKQLILSYTKGCPVKILLFGSQAKNTTHRHSDIDIAILPIAPLPIHFITKLREKIEESTIPYHVDLVDLSQTDEKFQNKVLQEGIEWKD